MPPAPTIPTTEADILPASPTGGSKHSSQRSKTSKRGPSTMHSTTQFHQNHHKGHFSEFTRESTAKPKNAAMGIGAAFSGVLLLITAKHEHGLEVNGGWGGALLLIVLVTLGLQDIVASGVKQSGRLGYRWITMMLQRSAVSSSNLRQSLSSSDALSRLSRVSSSVSFTICEKLKSYRRR